MDSLSEIAAIREVLLRYARGIDRRDWDVMVSVFTDDVHAVFQSHVLAGKAAIVDYVTTAAADFEILSSVHALNNMHIDVDGNTARAETTGIGYMSFRTHGGEPQLRMRSLRYVDELIHTADRGWLISKRVLTNDWEAVLPVRDMTTLGG